MEQETQWGMIMDQEIPYGQVSSKDMQLEASKDMDQETSKTIEPKSIYFKVFLTLYRAGCIAL